MNVCARCGREWEGTVHNCPMERSGGTMILQRVADPTMMAENARLRERVKALEAVVRLMVEWFWGVKPETAVESFERVGDEFYSETGMLRPGKSYPPNFQPPDDEDRRCAWEAWVKRKRDAIEAKARAVLAEGGK